MNIGVVLITYQSTNLASALAPWIELKRGIVSDAGVEIKSPAKDLTIKISVVSSLFPGFANSTSEYKNDTESRLLNSYLDSGFIDSYIEVKDRLLKEAEARFVSCGPLKRFGSDLVWQLDNDEIYNTDEILSALEFVKRNQLYDFYKIRFKNYIGDLSQKRYVDDFDNIRIFWPKRHGGIDNFYRDNEFQFVDGSRSENLPRITIPKGIINPNHYSWCWKNEEEKNWIIKKINYQNEVLGHCSYKFDENGDFILNEQYYRNIGKAKPTIFSET